jgi:hypothetical protein
MAKKQVKKSTKPKARKERPVEAAKPVPASEPQPEGKPVKFAKKSGKRGPRPLLPDADFDNPVKVAPAQGEPIFPEQDSAPPKKPRQARLPQMARLRSQVQPWYSALRALMGDLDAAGVEETSSSPSASGPLDAARYLPWKNKYPGQTASAIDILCKYEAGLTRKQLAGFLGIEAGSGSMSQIIFKLNKAELIHKDGTNIRLKRL